MNRKIVIVLILIGSSLAYAASLNQPNAQQQHRYIGLGNETNDTLVVDGSNPIPSTEYGFIEVPIGTTIAEILSKIHSGERTFQASPPLAPNTIPQNDAMITFTNSDNPAIITFSIEIYQALSDYTAGSHEDEESDESEEYNVSTPPNTPSNMNAPAA